MKDRSLQCEECGAQQGISPTGNCVVCGGGLTPTSSSPSYADKATPDIGTTGYGQRFSGSQGDSRFQVLPPGQRTASYASEAQQIESAEGYAIASLVLGILGGLGISAVLAIIFGNIALGRIRASGGILKGRTMAIVGVVLGWIGVVVTVLLVIVLLTR